MLKCSLCGKNIKDKEDRVVIEAKISAQEKDVTAIEIRKFTVHSHHFVLGKVEFIINLERPVDA